MNYQTDCSQRATGDGRRSLPVALIVFVFATVLATPPAFAQANNVCEWNGPWSPLPSAALSVARYGSTVTRLNDGRVLIAGGSDGQNTVAVAEVFDPATGSTTTVGSLAGARMGHLAERLDDGRVLVVGGSTLANGVFTGRLASAELFDPATGQFTPAGSMATARQFAASAKLADGRVLVTGGFGPTPYGYSAWLQTAEIFNPAIDAFVATGSMATGRGQHTSTLLPDGRVLIAGGETINGVTNTAEHFNPATGAFTPTPDVMEVARRMHTATLVNGGVFIVGGIGYNGYLNATERYYQDGYFSSTGPLGTPRAQHTAVSLPNGKVLIVGGNNENGDLASVEQSDITATGFEPLPAMPSPRQFHGAAAIAGDKVFIAGGWYAGAPLASALLYDPLFAHVGRMATMRIHHTATSLVNGSVLLAGGLTNGPSPTASLEIYSPATRSLSPAPSLAAARHAHTATRLADGRVLIAGGLSGPSSGAMASAEIYNPFTNSVSAAGSMNSPRYRHTATLLPSGRVLITGGSLNGVAYATAELYDPATNTFTPTGTMNRDRVDHTATLLGDGRVLIIGGRSAISGGITYSIELYDPASGTFYLPPNHQWLWTNREGHTATLLPSGEVLVTGGLTSGLQPTRVAEVYNPWWGEFSPAGNTVTARAWHTATTSELADGQVLLFGGATNFAGATTATVEAYDHNTRSFRIIGSMQFPRSRLTATLLPDSSVLVTGGRNSYGPGGEFAEVSKFTHCGPQITLLSPTAGQWGTPVTISGTQFGTAQGPNTVTFNGTPAPIASWSNGQIVTSVPHGATTGPVVVTVNGRASNGPAFTVGAPDLTIVGIAASPASPLPHQTVTVTVTVRNAGDMAVGPFRVDFYKHSATPPPGWGDFSCQLNGLGAASNGVCVGTVSYTAVGTQSLWAVIDVPDDIPESNESNNVFGPQSLVVQPVVPDLTQTAITNPPPSAVITSPFAVGDTVRNAGNGPAGASLTRYLLSFDTVRSANDPILLNRSVPALAAGATSSFSGTVYLSNLLAPGEYYMLVCADDLRAVAESNENNNCIASTTRVRVTAADVVTAMISNPPPAERIGSTFIMTDTVSNIGTASAGASTTRYWLSLDRQKGGDRLLGTRSVAALAAGASSTGSATLSLNIRLLQPGFYYVLACADDLQTVTESDNDNNCTSSMNRIEVLPGGIIMQ